MIPNGHGMGLVLPHAPEPPPPSGYEPAGVLSPSQVATFISCSAKWWFQYGLGIERTQGSSLGLGKAVHSVARVNYAQKIQSKRDLPLSSVLALYDDAWREEAAQTEFQPDEDADQVKLMGRACLTKYHQEVAPEIQPALVELAVSGIINQVSVRGFVDVLDVHGKIIDLKSAKATPSKGVIRPDYRFQISTYAAITPGASGEARLDTVVKLRREVKVVPQPFTVTEADRMHVERMYPLIQEAARSGLYVPNRNNYLCSRKYCPYVAQCLAEFGGAVGGETA